MESGGSDVIAERLERQAAVASGQLQLFEAERAGSRLGNRGGDSWKRVVLTLHLRRHFAGIVFGHFMLDSNCECSGMWLLRRRYWTLSMMPMFSCKTCCD